MVPGYAGRKKYSTALEFMEVLQICPLKLMGFSNGLSLFSALVKIFHIKLLSIIHHTLLCNVIMGRGQGRLMESSELMR